MEDAHHCPSCGSLYDVTHRRPRILTCLHTACEPCLQQHAAGASDGKKRRHDAYVICFTCRKKHRLGANGIKGFAENQYILGFLEKSQSEGRGDQQQQQQQQQQCAVHKQPVLLYCAQCSQVLCTTCLVKQHNGHTVKELNEELKRKQELFTAKTRTAIGQVAAGINKLTEMRSAVCAAESSARDALLSRRDRLRSCLTEDYKNKLFQVEHPAHQDVFALDAEIKRLEKSMTQLNDKLHSYSSFKTLIGAEPEVKIEVPDEITVTYSLPAYSASDIAGEYSSLLARLLGTIDSKKYECTIPITGKGKRKVDELIKVTFYNRVHPRDKGFKLDFQRHCTYDQMCKAVADTIKAHPEHLLFFRPHSTQKGPGNPIRYTFEGRVEDLLTSSQPHALYYTELEFPTRDLINRQMVRCGWLDLECMRAPLELILYPAKTGTLDDVMKEAAASVENFPEGKTRMVKIKKGQILSIVPDSAPVSSLVGSPDVQYRIDRVPDEELGPFERGEILIPCAHFTKAERDEVRTALWSHVLFVVVVVQALQGGPPEGEDVQNTFGVPFLLKVRVNLSFSQVKKSIKKKLKHTDFDIRKIRLAVCDSDKPSYITADEYTVQMRDFLPTGAGELLRNRPWLGLDHAAPSSSNSAQASSPPILKAEVGT